MLHPEKTNNPVIQDIVIYSNAPTGFEEVSLLGEDEEVPLKISETTLLLQIKNENLYIYTHANNKVARYSLTPDKFGSMKGVVEQLAKTETHTTKDKDTINKVKSKFECEQGYSYGEYNEIVETQTQQERLYGSICHLIDSASTQHKAQYCDENNNLKEEHNNKITRLVTNEFMFYTKKPLTLDEFNVLQQGIANYCSKQPENLHIVLSTFAVRTPDDKVMSVVAHIECGPDPKIHFIVKNNPSAIDPVYSEMIEDKKKILPNVDINNKDNINFKININGKSCGFSFDNVIKCQTAGGSEFYSCIDICKDYALGVAKNNLIEELISQEKENELDTILCSHIVTANYIPLKDSESAPNPNKIGPITHADPANSGHISKQGAATLSQDKILNLSFGPELNVAITVPVACHFLPKAIKNEILGIESQSADYMKLPLPPKATKMAKELKSLQANLLSELKDSDFEGDISVNPGILKISLNNHNLSDMVKDDILLAAPLERGAIISFYVELIKACLEQGDHLSARVILGALNSKEIYDLQANFLNADQLAFLTSKEIATISDPTQYEAIRKRREIIPIISTMLKPTDDVDPLKKLRDNAKKMEKIPHTDVKKKVESQHVSSLTIGDVYDLYRVDNEKDFKKIKNKAKSSVIVKRESPDLISVHVYDQSGKHIKGNRKLDFTTKENIAPEANEQVQNELNNLKNVYTELPVNKKITCTSHERKDFLRQITDKTGIPLKEPSIIISDEIVSGLSEQKKKKKKETSEKTEKKIANLQLHFQSIANEKQKPSTMAATSRKEAITWTKPAQKHLDKKIEKTASLESKRKIEKPKQK